MNGQILKQLKVMTVGFFAVGFMLTSNAVAKDSAIEKRLQALEESTASLQKELTRAQDILAIQTLQGRYEAVHNSDESLSYVFFANRPDTSKEITRDKIIGYDNILADYKRMAGGGAPPGMMMPGGEMPSGEGMGAPPGNMSGDGPSGDMPAGGPPEGMGGPGRAEERIKAIHPIASPVIVVADDGKTAKATFTSFGLEGNSWCYGKYANSYIKIDGEWYIWHMKWLRCFKTPFDTAWYDQTAEEVYEFTTLDEDGNPILDPNIAYNYLAAPGKTIKTITAPVPYATWTEADEDGGWWKGETQIPSLTEEK